MAESSLCSVINFENKLLEVDRVEAGVKADTETCDVFPKAVRCCFVSGIMVVLELADVFFSSRSNMEFCRKGGSIEMEVTCLKLFRNCSIVKEPPKDCNIILGGAGLTGSLNPNTSRHIVLKVSIRVVEIAGSCSKI